MSKDKKHQKEAFEQEEKVAAEEPLEQEAATSADDKQQGLEEADSTTIIKELGEQLAQLNDRYLRTVAEYENYRRRTAKEKSDLILHGGEKTISELLPVIDDLELALQNVRSAEDLEAMRTGIELIVDKFFAFLKRQGVTSLDVIDKPFDMVSQQAIAIVPVDDPSRKGIVIDCTKKGYMLHDKVLRYADVVVGE